MLLDTAGRRLWAARSPWLAVLLVLGATGAGCGSEPEPLQRPPAAERILEEGHAPTPYTAEQIRQGCPDGRRSTYRLEGGSTKPILQRFTFREGDAAGTRVWVTVVDAEGEPLRAPVGRRSTWRELQGHASYPAELTVITDATTEVPAGRFACLLYTVKSTGSGVEKVTKAWFAHEIPGPPVRMEDWWDGQLQESMILIEHRQPSAPEVR